MPKVLCLTGCVVAILVFLVFLLDISTGIPFSKTNMILDIVFMLVSGTLAWLSWATFREQV